MGAMIQEVLKNDRECETLVLNLKGYKFQEGTSIIINLSYSLFDKISLEQLQSLFAIIESLKLSELHLSVTHISEILTTPPLDVPPSFQAICDLVQKTQTDKLYFDYQNLHQLGSLQIARLSKAFQECMAKTLSLKHCCLGKVESLQQSLLFSGLSKSKISTFHLEDNELTPEAIEKISQDQSYYQAQPLLFGYLGPPSQHVNEYLGIPSFEVKP